MHLMKSVSLIALLGAGLLLSGCATRESVEHAQATADTARSDAAGARSAADRAQSSADGAGKSAQDAMASAQMANDKIDKLIAQLEAKHHQAKRHHRRHTAAATTPGSCPPQQKTELKIHPKAATNRTQSTRSPEKTARN